MSILPNKKVIVFLALIFVGLLFAYMVFFTAKNTSIMSILDEAETNKKETGYYGVISDHNLQKFNCFSGDTFMKREKIKKILELKEVDSVSCKFQVNKDSGVLEKWSVSLQSGEKVFCGDSDGLNQETPGFTLTTSCKGE
jgi:hypothetical protein